MNVPYFLTIAGALVLGGVITVSVGYFLVKSDIQRYLGLKAANLKNDEKTQLLSLKLHAHERLILFIERINPANLFIRVYQQGISAAGLQSILLNEIRSEYQHNVSQQLYVRTETWNVLKQLKDDTLAMINNAAKELPEDAAGIDLSKKILQHMAGISANPYDLTLDLIKKDIHQLQ